MLGGVIVEIPVNLDGSNIAGLWPSLGFAPGLLGLVKRAEVLARPAVADRPARGPGLTSAA